MSDFRRLLQSLENLSEAQPKGMAQRPWELTPIEGGGGGGGGLGGGGGGRAGGMSVPPAGRSGIGQGIGQAAKPRITRLPGETPAQAIARAQAQAATPLPPGVTPSTAGAGRGAVNPPAGKPAVWRKPERQSELDRELRKSPEQRAADVKVMKQAEKILAKNKEGPPNLQVPPKMQGQKKLWSPAVGAAAAASQYPGGKEGGSCTAGTQGKPDDVAPQAAVPELPPSQDTTAPSKVDLPQVGPQGENSPFYVVTPDSTQPSGTKPDVAPAPAAQAPTGQAQQPAAQPQQTRPNAIPVDQPAAPTPAAAQQPQASVPTQQPKTQQEPAPSGAPATGGAGSQGTGTTSGTGTGGETGASAGQGTGTGAGIGSGAGKGGRVPWFDRWKEVQPDITRESKKTVKEATMRDLLEKIDSMVSAEKKPTGPKFPGYWKGNDPASKSKSKMVGSAEESIIKDLDKTAKDCVTEWRLQNAFEQFKADEKIGGRYDPADFDLLVNRLGKKAKEQERKRGPVDIKKLAQRLHGKPTRQKANEIEDPAVNKQDPDVQVTSQTSPNQDPAAVKQQQIDQAQDVSTAKSTMSGLSTVLGPGVNPNALSSAVNKISDNKPLTAPEATSMSALTPLIAKAAETPQSAPALKTALSNAAMLARQGK